MTHTQVSGTRFISIVSPPLVKFYLILIAFTLLLVDYISISLCIVVFTQKRSWH